MKHLPLLLLAFALAEPARAIDCRTEMAAVADELGMLRRRVAGDRRLRPAVKAKIAACKRMLASDVAPDARRRWQKRLVETRAHLEQMNRAEDELARKERDLERLARACLRPRGP